MSEETAQPLATPLAPPQKRSYNRRPKPAPEPVAPASPAAVIQPPPVVVTAESTAPAWTPIQVGEVAQVNNPTSRFYGVMFTVGDVRGQQIHGYQILTGGKMEFITAMEEECFRVGIPKVKSRKTCSDKWAADAR